MTASLLCDATMSAANAARLARLHARARRASPPLRDRGGGTPTHRGGRVRHRNRRLRLTAHPTSCEHQSSSSNSMTATPVLGSRRRRHAARQLADLAHEASPEAIAVLAQAVATSEDQAVSEIASAALRTLPDGLALRDALCRLAAEEGDEVALRIACESGYGRPTSAGRPARPRWPLGRSSRPSTSTKRICSAPTRLARQSCGVASPRPPAKRGVLSGCKSRSGVGSAFASPR